MLVANITSERLLMKRTIRGPKLKKDELVTLVVEAIASGRYRILPHARQRCTERDVSAADIECAMSSGHSVPSRDRYDTLTNDWSYCFEGYTIDEERLRVVVAFESWMLVVTVVRLDD
jgi:Domain of unknown function (DUF4258)